MNIKQFFGIVEIRTKIISMSTFFMGTLYAYLRTGEFSVLMLFVMMFSVLCVDMGTTGFNAYYDYKNGTDDARNNTEKNKVLLHQGVDARKALGVSAVLFVLAGISGIVIAYLTSWYVIVVGAICMGVGYIYTGGPYPISRTPLGEIVAGGFLGTVLFVLSYFVQVKELSWAVIFVSLSSSAIVASILTANNSCDLVGDKEVGRKTLSILVGAKASELLIYLLGLGAYGWAGIMIALDYYPVITTPFFAVGLVLTGIIYRGMHRIGYSFNTKDPIMGNISKVYLVFTLMNLLGFGTAVLMGY
ncbi:MAG: prenyltransferase [Bacteroidetes bacterium]|nr:prenyltransferase [Bacteroidota bacterium]